MQYTTEYEFNTFILGRITSTAGRYKTICDYAEVSGNGIACIAIKLRKSYKKEFSAEELKFTEEVAREYWIERLANMSAVELIAQGRVSTTTLTLMHQLTEEDFSEVVKKATMISKDLNDAVVGAEKSTNSNAVPSKYL